MRHRITLTEDNIYHLLTCNLVPILFGERVLVCTTIKRWNCINIDDVKYGIGCAGIDAVFVGEDVFKRRMQSYKQFCLPIRGKISGIERIWNIGRRKQIKELLFYRYGAELYSKDIKVNIKSINDITIVTSSKCLVDEFRLIWQRCGSGYKVLDIQTIHID